MKNRPYKLNGVTHEFKLDHIPEPLYLTINDAEVHGKTVPYEVFLNCNDTRQWEWMPVASRLISAILRNTGSNDFLYKELQELFAADWFMYKKKKYHSVIQLIGSILEAHAKELEETYK